MVRTFFLSFKKTEDGFSVFHCLGNLIDDLELVCRSLSGFVQEVFESQNEMQNHLHAKKCQCPNYESEKLK